MQQLKSCVYSRDVPEDGLCEDPEGLEVDPGRVGLAEVHLQPVHQGTLQLAIIMIMERV